MMALGFPRGLSANAAGFPILRSGRVASYPLGPGQVFPTFLLDFSVFPGNSGGPVFISRAPKTQGVTQVSNDEDPGFIAGLLTQQVELNSERLEIGIVTHAKFIRETLALLQNPLAPATVTVATPVVGGRTASAEEAARNQAGDPGGKSRPGPPRAISRRRRPRSSRRCRRAWLSPSISMVHSFLSCMPPALGSAPISFWRMRTRLPTRTMLMKRTLSEP